MKPLIDGDIFLYEIGFGAELGWEGETPPFDYVADLLDIRVVQICNEVNATEKPIIFLTGKDNFRNEIATLRKYKGNRDKVEKPFHYENIKLYLLNKYKAITVDGMEADDALAVTQLESLAKGEQTIICTRDKDLRMVPGWHYSWELGKQPSWGPIYVVDPGYLELKKVGKVNKINGTGLMWFYAQCLLGDSCDDVPGIKGLGPVKVYKLLNECQPEEALDRVYEQYVCHYGEEGEKYLQEQGSLLWMTREMKEGKPVIWRL